MRLPLAPPTIFRARAIAATGCRWLADGFHFRVTVNPWIGFPLHPFAAWRLRRGLGEEIQSPIVWRDPAGRSIAMPFDVESAGGEVYGTVLTTNAAGPWVWIEFVVENGGMRIDLLDSTLVGAGDRILASRTREPFAFADAELLYFRVTGAGRVIDARGIQADTLAIDEIRGRRPDFTFGLPIRTNDWYAEDPRMDPRDAALRRVRAAAATRLSPPDNPTGRVPDVTDPDAETERIMGVVGPGLVDPWLTEGFGDPATAPVASLHRKQDYTSVGKKLTASAPITPSLLTMAVDPQIARYLGLAAMVGFDETAPMDRRNLWLIASRWAVQPNRIVREIDEAISSVIPISDAAASVRLKTVLGLGGDPPFVNGLMDSSFPDTRGIVARLPDVPDPEGYGRWSPVTLIALAVAPGDAPPDPPDPFELSAHRPVAWNAHADPEDPGPESWRQTISLGARPARGMVGFARMSPGEPASLQQVVPAHGEPTARVLPLVPNWASNNERVLTDRSVPPDPAGASWQVWQADEFGQWSEAAPFNAPLAERPLPPIPVAEVTYTALPDDHSGGSRIPGTINLSLDVPTPAKSAPGSLPITTLDVTVDGTPLAPISVTPGAKVRHDFQPRPFAVGEHRPVTIDVTFTDIGDQTSPPQTLQCGVFDARAPQVVPTSPIVIWTGQADATGQAELALKWPPSGGAARYRIYLGDLRRLAGGLRIELTGGTVRSADAKPIHDRSASLADKHLFTFLGEAPGTPEADGLIHYSTRIPGSLRGVHFVRIVPMTQGGAEAPFAQCGLVPVAVPGADRPPPPIVETVGDPASGVIVIVRARGFRTEVLGAGAGKPPEFRIRRTRRANVNREDIPLQPDGGPLTGPDADGVWTATFTAPTEKLDPFVRYRWFAETCYPAEPPIPPGAFPQPVPGGVEPVWTTLGSESESIWSDPSLAAESLLIPPHDPQPPPAPTVTRRPDGATEVHLGNLPMAAPDAIGAYRLEIYRVAGNAPPNLAATLTPGTGEFSWTDASPLPPTDSYAIVLVDPIERRSSPAFAAPPRS